MAREHFIEHLVKRERKWVVLYRLDLNNGPWSDTQKQLEEFYEIINIGRLYGYG